MVKTDWTIYEEDYWAINSELKQLLKNSNSQSVLLIDKTGQMIASVGMEPDFDLMSFASLCAADFEANSQLAKLIGEKDFSTLYHQGSDESMYLAKVASQIFCKVALNGASTDLMGQFNIHVGLAHVYTSAIRSLTEPTRVERETGVFSNCLINNSAVSVGLAG